MVDSNFRALAPAVISVKADNRQVDNKPAPTYERMLESADSKTSKKTTKPVILSIDNTAVEIAVETVSETEKVFSGEVSLQFIDEEAKVFFLVPKSRIPAIAAEISWEKYSAMPNAGLCQMPIPIPDIKNPIPPLLHMPESRSASFLSTSPEV